MPEVISNTSPIQYLHQRQLLHILPALAGHVIVPPAVVNELMEGRALGIQLPDLTVLSWVGDRACFMPLAKDNPARTGLSEAGGNR